jgi:hypothetical protein
MDLVVGIDDDQSLSIEDEVLRWDMEYKRTPSVISWLIPRKRVLFMRRTQDMPSVVTWFIFPKSADGDLEFNPSPSERGEDGEMDINDDDPFGRLYSPFRDADALNRVLPGDEEESTLDSPNEEKTNFVAAVKIQSATRGMIDRKFYKRLRFSLQRRYSSKSIALISSPSKKLIRVETKKQNSWAEPDGYLSSATEKKIKERGAPLARHKVEEKYNALIKTKIYATLLITSPNASESENPWEAGETRCIKWTCEGTIRINKVGLYLYKDGEPVHLIVAGSKNGGRYIFTMPETFQPAPTYQILITPEDPKLDAAHAFSAPFSLAPRRPGAVTKRPAPLPTITMTFPVRPLWRWICGASHKVTWTSSGGIHNVQIDVLRHDLPALRVVASTINVGMVEFTMPLAAPTGDDFRLRVRSTTNKRVEGLSLPFSIVDRQASLAVPRLADPARRRRPSSPGEARSTSRILRPLGGASSPYAAPPGWASGSPSSDSRSRRGQTLRDSDSAVSALPGVRWDDGGGGGDGDPLAEIVQRDRPAVLTSGDRPAKLNDDPDSEEDFAFDAAYQRLGSAQLRTTGSAGSGPQVLTRPRHRAGVASPAAESRPDAAGSARTDRFVLPRIGHTMAMQSALTPAGPPPALLWRTDTAAAAPRASKRSRRGGPATGGATWAREPWWQAMLAEGRVRPDGAGAAAGRAASEAEEFLERRDRIFAEQLQALRAGMAPPARQAGAVRARFETETRDMARVERGIRDLALDLQVAVQGDG